MVNRIRYDLTVHPGYLKKCKDLLNSKQSFDAWAARLLEFSDISLVDSLALFKEYDIRIPRILSPDTEHDLTFFRARVIPKNSNEDLSKPSTFSYPPAKLVTTFQRANAPGFPVFYGAADGKTALEELRINGQQIKAGDTVFLSKWRLKRNISYNFVNLTIPEIDNEHQLYAGITKKISAELERIFAAEDPF